MKNVTLPAYQDLRYNDEDQDITYLTQFLFSYWNLSKPSDGPIPIPQWLCFTLIYSKWLAFIGVIDMHLEFQPNLPFYQPNGDPIAYDQYLIHHIDNKTK